MLFKNKSIRTFLIIIFCTSFYSFKTDELGLYKTLSIVGRGIEPNRAIELMKDVGFGLDTARDLPRYHIYDFSNNDATVRLTTFLDYRENSWIIYEEKN
jgi:hypothetical protein